MTVLEFACVDPDVRTRYGKGYRQGTLSASERQAFEDHLIFCRKCQEEMGFQSPGDLQQEMLAWYQAVRMLHPAVKIQPLWQTPLVVSALYDLQHQNLLPYYEDKPLTDRLAASTAASQVIFPLTLEYADGQIVGRFWKRGKYLWFRLQHIPAGSQPSRYALIYTAPTDPPEVRTFDFPEQEQRLGPFREFVDAETLQALIAAIKRFRLVVKQEDA